MNISETDTCFFGDNSVESIEHLFFSCPSVQPLWRYIKNTLENRGIKLFNLNNVTILFGVRSDKTFNLILILVKYYTFLSKLNKTRLSVTQLNHFLNKYFDVQKYILTLKMKRGIWERYWLPWFNLLQLEFI